MIADVHDPNPAIGSARCFVLWTFVCSRAGLHGWRFMAAGRVAFVRIALEKRRSARVVMETPSVDSSANFRDTTLTIQMTGWGI